MGWTEHLGTEEPDEEGELFLVEASGYVRGMVCNIEYDHDMTLASWYCTGWESKDIDIHDMEVHRWWRLPA